MSKVLKRDVEIKNTSSRRSIRRINKMLEKNLSQFKIPNPYRSYRSHPCLPQTLSKQLSKLEYLSIRSLQSLHFKEHYLQEQLQELLLKMRFAVKAQSQEFNNFSKMMAQKIKKEMEQKQMQKNTKKSQQETLRLISQPPEEQKQSSSQYQQSEQLNLPLVMHQSEGASMMGDNYEADKLGFNLRHFIGNQAIQNQQHLESYQI